MIVNGVLQFYGWQNQPWAILHQDGTLTDIWPIVAAVLHSLVGQRTQMQARIDGFGIEEYVCSDARLEWEDEEKHYPLLIEDGGFSNVGAYLEQSLVLLNGQHVWFADEGSDKRPGFSITRDVFSKPHEIWFSGEGNFCSLTDEEVKAECKPGAGKNTCIFLLMSSTGWECAKGDGPTARGILDRAHRQEMNAGRIGSCKLAGRRR